MLEQKKYKPFSLFIQSPQKPKHSFTPTGKTQKRIFSSFNQQEGQPQSIKRKIEHHPLDLKKKPRTTTQLQNNEPFLQAAPQKQSEQGLTLDSSSSLKLPSKEPFYSKLIQLQLAISGLRNGSSSEFVRLTNKKRKQKREFCQFVISENKLIDEEEEKI